ncbi:CTCF [Drosophila busckii]|uniref:CTCF n=1 Tax=Drosophila busckii TaxID=30019 RepID=A0A0M4EDL8_DROBS|nr:transcriptional repressor CTCFL [Drosophila busckii]ALC43721.1 CTCF [Drosophila busckii]
MSKRRRDSDAEDLQSFLINFHKEIEDSGVSAGAAEPTGANAEAHTEPAEEQEDDDDEYFIDDEGNCYVKAPPKKVQQLKKKLKPINASSPAPASIAIRNANSTTSSKAINLRPAQAKATEATPKKVTKAITVRTAASPKKSVQASTPKAYARSLRSATKTAKLSDVKLEEMVDGSTIEIDLNETITSEQSANKDGASDYDDVGAVDDEVYDFDESAANRTAKSDVDFVVTGKQYKLKSPAKSTAQQKYACSHCSYTTNKKFLITRHVRSHDAELSFKCSICERGFKSNMGLVNHLNTHMGNKPHKCKLCESAFTTSGELIRHTRYKHTKEKPHKCTECSYASVELTKLRRHMTCHTGERPYQCPHCTYASQDMFKLKRHLVIHTGEKKYQCDICQSRFTQSNSLKAHKLIHSVVDKPVFQCTLCPTTCGRKADLRTHMANMHTSDKPIACKRCGQELPDRYQYKLHIKTHEGEKCYRCNLCSYASVSQRHLDSHMLIHTDSKPLKCDLCPQAFRQRQLLRRHINLVHNDQYKAPEPREKVHSCPNCSRSFTHKGNLMRHMETHDETLDARDEKLKLKLGRNVRLQPDGSIVTVVNGSDIEALGRSADINLGEELQYEISQVVEEEEEEDMLVPDNKPERKPQRVMSRMMQKQHQASTAKKPVIINRQLKLKSPRTKPLTSQGGTFRIKEEPDATEFTVELQGDSDQFMVVQLVNNDDDVVIKREHNADRLNENNCFGFEDEQEEHEIEEEEEEYEEYVEPAAEVDASSQDFLRLMHLIEQDT